MRLIMKKETVRSIIYKNKSSNSLTNYGKLIAWMLEKTETIIILTLILAGYVIVTSVFMYSIIYLLK